MTFGTHLVYRTFCFLDLWLQSFLPYFEPQAKKYSLIPSECNVSFKVVSVQIVVLPKWCEGVIPHGSSLLWKLIQTGLYSLASPVSMVPSEHPSCHPPFTVKGEFLTILIIPACADSMFFSLSSVTFNSLPPCHTSCITFPQYHLHFDTDDRGRLFLKNVGIHLWIVSVNSWSKSRKFTCTCIWPTITITRLMRGIW
jgi:hypothetical protein